MKKSIQLTVTGLCGIVVVALCGCAGLRGKPAQTAVAEVKPTQGNTAHGTVTFTKTSKGIRVVAEIMDLTPGLHGFHLHEKGDCSSADAMSAGGHFNPAGMPHGGPASVRRHSGDFGNLVANSSGRAYLKLVDPLLTFDGPSSILGRAVVVHANPDDLVTDPAGNSGPRVACGVIERPQPQPAQE